MEEDDDDDDDFKSTLRHFPEEWSSYLLIISVYFLIFSVITRFEFSYYALW